MAQVPVPGADAPLEVILHFASFTYYGYDRHGGLQGLFALGLATWEEWKESGQLPRDLAVVRAALFFEGRRWHHHGEEPDPESAVYLRALVRQISELSGGSVRADREGPAIWLRRFSNRCRPDP